MQVHRTGTSTVIERTRDFPLHEASLLIRLETSSSRIVEITEFAQSTRMVRNISLFPYPDCCLCSRHAEKCVLLQDPCTRSLAAAVWFIAMEICGLLAFVKLALSLAIALIWCSYAKLDLFALSTETMVCAAPHRFFTVCFDVVMMSVLCCFVFRLSELRYESFRCMRCRGR